MWLASISEFNSEIYSFKRKEHFTNICKCNHTFGIKWSTAKSLKYIFFVNNLGG